LIKGLLEENPGAKNSELLRLVRECVDDYKQDWLDEGRPHLSSIDGALKSLETFMSWTVQRKGEVTHIG
jgi:hypothetical protein